MKCLYHANCNDGAGAAWAVWMAHGDRDNEYIPVQYGNPPPQIERGEKVIMVDFSYPKDVISRMAAVAGSILIIDHHKTAEDDLSELDRVLIRDSKSCFCQVSIVFDMEKSGAVLAWEHFHPQSEVPQLLLHIQDRDLWRFELEGTKPITAAIRLYPDWREWGSDADDMDRLRIQGGSIIRFLQMESEKIVLTPPVEWRMTGHVVPLYNIPGFMISDTLHLALEVYPDVPYAVAYFDLPDKRVYSLRSRNGSHVDVSEIAKARGGGGHKHAAGFTTVAVER